MPEPATQVDVKSPVSRPKWRGRYWIPVAALFLATYVTVYLAARRIRPLNVIHVRIGGFDDEVTQVLFAPPIWCEQAIRVWTVGDAEDRVQSALNHAAANGKRAMLIFTDGQCPGCVRLKSFLDDNAEVVAKYFAIVQLLPTMRGFDVIESRYRRTADSEPDYIPFIVITDSDGNEIANSGIKLSEPIALPSGSDENRVRFLDLLQTTAIQMTADDAAALRHALEQ